ncbi:hypothetical protein GGP41_009741 [Bipolaris sorokiniana]|uniref:Uncharacterized protein n=1 Tax=Cochliobolus sativus TaxID=45130 RepID=A0A8H5ZIZ2_COCSA|nr:hypothetical protein GGP41_009741 [Bipolaris sorokiniana]
MICVPWSQCPIYPQRSSHGPLFQLPLLGYLHLIWPVPRTRKRAIITERKPGNVQDEASGCRPRDGCTEWLRGIATRGREMHAYMHGHLDPLDEKKKGRKNWQKQSRGTEGGGSDQQPLFIKHSTPQTNLYTALSCSDCLTEV